MILSQSYDPGKILLLRKHIHRARGIRSKISAHVRDVRRILQRCFQIQQQNPCVLGGIGFNNEELVFHTIGIVLADRSSRQSVRPE